jgi:hypothetical protein
MHQDPTIAEQAMRWIDTWESVVAIHGVEGLVARF